ncbi:MAG: hypothetical protein AAF676_08385 [Pseudomonadota bacterium]
MDLHLIVSADPNPGGPAASIALEVRGVAGPHDEVLARLERTSEGEALIHAFTMLDPMRRLIRLACGRIERLELHARGDAVDLAEAICNLVSGLLAHRPGWSDVLISLPADRRG